MSLNLAAVSFQPFDIGLLLRIIRFDMEVPLLILLFLQLWVSKLEGESLDTRAGWSRGVVCFGINDVLAVTSALSTQMMNDHSSGIFEDDWLLSSNTLSPFHLLTMVIFRTFSTYKNPRRHISGETDTYRGYYLRIITSCYYRF